MIPLIYGTKNNINESMYRTETDSHDSKQYVYQRGEKEQGRNRF